MASLELSDISKAYGATPVLERVSLTMEPREFIAFLGPSGSGKSTLLRIIAGLETLDEGEVRLEGRRIDPLPLSTGHLAGLLVQMFLDLEHSRGIGDTSLDLRFRHARIPEAERHVLANRHVRVERVMLEDHRDFAIAGRQSVDAPPVEMHLALIELLEAGDDPQQG